MYYVVAALFVINCFVLMFVILLQQGKGGDIASAFGGAAAEHCHIIYGGSVKPDNIRDLAALPDVDGALVGGASLDLRSFFEIVSRSRPAAV